MNEVSAKPFSGAYCGWHSRENPPLVLDIAQTGPGTPCGELMRRSWQPVCFSADLKDVPFKIRILGEDLVAFRDLSGRVGVFHKQCVHRGASLEFGRIDQRGLRCCYHGWHYDIDGTLIDAPAEPADSPIRKEVCQPAYPAEEHHGLVFAYMGPPEQRPPFPRLDAYCRDDTRIVPYSNHFPCNWLQVQENLMDPAHAVFLHARMGTVQFTPAWGENGTIDFVRHKDRLFYVHCRRVDENVWVRVTETALPNMGQTAGLWEDGSTEKIYEGAAITRWTVPVDDTNCIIYGFRYFNAALESNPMGNPDECGHDKVDGYGQTGNRPYDMMQRNPGDWEVEVSLGPIANHNREHRGSSDLGVVTLRRLIRRGFDDGFETVPVASDGTLPMYAGNTVYRLPAKPGQDDEAYLRAIGKRYGEILIAYDDLPYAERQRVITEKLTALKQEFA